LDSDFLRNGLWATGMGIIKPGDVISFVLSIIREVEGYEMAKKKETFHMNFPSMTMGVMGSSGGIIDREVLKRVYELGREIGLRGYVLITGACPGIPHEAVKGAKSVGGFVVGISPALNFAEHIVRFKSPVRGYDALVFTGSGLMGREIENIRSCDVVIFAGGRSGTLGEFAIAYDEAKIIGVLQETDGIADHLSTILTLVHKNTGSILVASNQPAELIDKLEELYRSHLLPIYQNLVDTHNPDGELEK
jgi:uncharacterized protein (TIGR00725 family)